MIAALVFLWLFVETWRECSTAGRRSALLAKLRRQASFLPETRRETTHFSVLGVTAGITEEIIFRGFLISYLMAFTGGSPLSLVIAVALPGAVFMLGHLYEGWSAAFRVFMLAIAFGGIYVDTGSLLVPIVVHAVIDVAMGILAWRLAHEEAKGRSTDTDEET